MCKNVSGEGPLSQVLPPVCRGTLSFGASTYPLHLIALDLLLCITVPHYAAFMLLNRLIDIISIIASFVCVLNILCAFLSQLRWAKISSVEL